jgi:hypothetical protein
MKVTRRLVRLMSWLGGNLTGPLVIFKRNQIIAPKLTSVRNIDDDCMTNACVGE